MRFILGLTGPTGSGKSTACTAAEGMGWYVIDCDRVAREATEQEEALKALTAAFGEDILNSDGSLSRKSLAQKAFSSADKTELLNSTILPFILELIKEKIKNSNSEKILLDAPTLYESGADRLCDAVCAILSAPDNRLARILSRDNIDLSAARLRMSAGKSDEYYKSKTPHIIYNDADTSTLLKEFTKLLKTFGGN